jgi:hypothetical protein
VQACTEGKGDDKYLLKNSADGICVPKECHELDADVCLKNDACIVAEGGACKALSNKEIDNKAQSSQRWQVPLVVVFAVFTFVLLVVVVALIVLVLKSRKKEGNERAPPSSPKTTTVLFAAEAEGDKETVHEEGANGEGGSDRVEEEIE